LRPCLFPRATQDLTVVVCLVLRLPGTPWRRMNLRSSAFLQQAVRRAADASCPSLLTKRVTPDLVRHYLPFLTMSGTGHMQKALFEMNVQLSNVISDIVGETGLNILEASNVVRFPTCKAETCSSGAVTPNESFRLLPRSAFPFDQY
jgi:hypothetical protein